MYKKNKWRLHTTYPKRECPKKHTKISLFFERPNFPDLSHQAALASGENHTWVINELEPISEPLDTPQEVEVISGDLSKILKIGSTLLTLEKEKMVSLLRANQDVFARKHEDMPVIDRKIIQYHLNVNPECKLVQQK